MLIELLTPIEAARRTRASLGLDGKADDPRSFIAAALRRAAGIMCPCRPGELVRAVSASLRPLADAILVTEPLIQDVLDEMLMIGDVAEVIFDSGPDSPHDKLSLCLMPFSFVRRSQGQVTLLGGRADEAMTLPNELAQRVSYRGAMRELSPRDPEDLPSLLLEFGLNEIAADAWLRLPKKESMSAHIAIARAKMPMPSAPRAIEGLHIIGEGRIYARRWCEPSKHTGFFVARRPQAYGAPVWSAVELRDGEVTSLLDLHAPGSRWRPCDVAWLLQAALDATAGAPHQFRCTLSTSNSVVILDLFAPLPSWAERRLRLVGLRMPAAGSLMSFAIPVASAVAECQFLQDYLWMRDTRSEGAV